MATVRDVVRRSLRIAKITDADREPEAHELADGIEALNDMLSGWSAQGVALSHTDYADGNATFETSTLTAKFRDHVTYCLAQRIAGEYEVELTPSAVARALDAWRVIQANFLTSVDLKVDTGLRVMPSAYWGLGRNRSL